VTTTNIPQAPQTLGQVGAHASKQQHGQRLRRRLRRRRPRRQRDKA